MSKQYNKYSKSGLIKRTLPYIAKNKKKMIFCIATVIAIAVLTTITPRITKTILDDYISVGTLDKSYRYNMIFKLLGLYAGLTVIVVILRYVQNYVFNLIGMNIERLIREEAILKVNHLPVDYFSLEPDGKIVAKITSDSNGVRTYFTMMFSICQAMINLIAVYLGMILLEWILAIIILVAAPIIYVWITYYRRKVHSYYQELRETSSRITGKLNELISGALIIQAYNQEEYMLGDYKDLVNDYNYQNYLCILWI